MTKRKRPEYDPEQVDFSHALDRFLTLIYDKTPEDLSPLPKMPQSEEEEEGGITYRPSYYLTDNAESLRLMS